MRQIISLCAGAILLGTMPTVAQQTAQQNNKVAQAAKKQTSDAQKEKLCKERCSGRGGWEGICIANCMKE
jgi:hypothetical protein